MDVCRSALRPASWLMQVLEERRKVGNHLMSIFLTAETAKEHNNPFTGGRSTLYVARSDKYPV